MPILIITRLGADGDGLATLPDGTPAFVPFALPGETVHARLGDKRGTGRAATLEAIETPAPDRIAPACRHFGTCGGCVLQHWRADSAAAWKTGLLDAALRRAGFTGPPLLPITTTPPGARRRMDLALQRTGRTLHVGLHPARSRNVVDLGECPVLHPDLAGLIGKLRALLAPLDIPRRAGSAIANLLDEGPDLLLRGDAPLAAPARAALVEFARAANLVRLSWANGQETPEPLAIFRPPVVTLSGIQVMPPPGGFLQASREGEAAIVAAVLAGLDAAPRLPRGPIVELYAGCGTLTFALAARAPVQAFEGDAAAVAALKGAANKSGLGSRVTATQRDLARQPLAGPELSKAAAVVLDPPYTGAAAQMALLAAARPPRIIHVGCNPAILTRDLRPLHDAGYRVLAATPIDQFRWSARLESVTVLAR